MPELDPTKLTFAAVMSLLAEMLTVPSGGAHEQLIAAALLEAKVEQAGTAERVETKNLTASDRSSATPADVQVKHGNEIREAFEVTANEWVEKVDEAGRKIRAYDLKRLHIIARIDPQRYEEMLDGLRQLGFDLSALDLRAFFSVHVAELQRVFRASALRRIYELLERRQPDIALVNAFVERLHRHGLTVPAGGPSSDLAE
jgi:hypothetical protein